MRRILILVFLLGGLARLGIAQEAPYLPYYTTDTARVFQLAVAHRKAVQSHLVLPKTGNSEYREHYRKVVREASQDVYNSIRHSALLDPVVEPYVQQVFARILQANPQLPAGTKLVLTRNPEANAHAVGSSTVVLNIGLLLRLENESQLAFILCHELAHISCQHMEKTLQERLTALHSKEMKREFRRIINSEYNISSQIKDLALGFSLNHNYHSRRFEKQADSLGYVLLTRTTFEPAQAYRALQLLDKINEPETAEGVNLSTYFSCAEFPKTFEGVAARPKSIFTVKTEETVLQTTDTLKTHPDCVKRMGYLYTLAQGKVADGVQPASPPEFARIRYVSRLEVIQSWFDFDCYDHALFEALLLLPQQPRNPYLHSMVLLSLYKLRQHLVAHTYSEVVSNISKHHPARFNDLLYSLHGLRNEDFPGLAACFTQAVTTDTAAPADEYALAARYTARALSSDDRAAADFKAQYQQQYADGRFGKLLFPEPAKARATRR